MKKKILFLTAVYFFLIHIFLIILVLKSDILELIKRNFIYPKTEMSGFYNEMLKFHLRIDGNLQNNSVLFIGDSLVQGLCATCVIPKGINFGIGGDTSVGVLNRIKKYKSIERVKAVVLAFGINDMPLRDDDDIIYNFIEIIKSIPVRTKIIISAVLPVARQTDIRNRSNRRIDKFNLKLKTTCNLFKNCFYFNPQKDLIDDYGNLNDSYHVGDGIHLNAKGYNIWINDIKKALDSM